MQTRYKKCYSLTQKIVRIIFLFTLKTVESRVLDIKDIVARALIYSTLYYYIGKRQISQKSDTQTRHFRL